MAAPAPIHAPGPVAKSVTCGGRFSSHLKVAAPGQTVTCRACLRILARRK